jgi:thymidine phosphorylase
MSVALDAIEAKKAGDMLDEATIGAVVNGYVSGDIPDYQMAALLMAIRWRGMSYEETLALTRVMADSGPRYSFPDCVDKHSTGGVGDKVTLTALPIVAACGAPVAKLSGRGLGITGGTIDKLEAIPGFDVHLSEERFRRQVETVGMVIGEAGELAPADKAIYALRDITGTVDSLPLIGSSIVSKKVATGAGYLLYDVKAGSGAFMKTVEDALELAELLVKLSKSLGIHSSAVVTDMDAPLGRAVGNALEVRESVAFLRGEPTSPDLAEVARDVAVRLLELHGEADPERAVDDAIDSGKGYEKFAEVVHAQGGDDAALADLPVSQDIRDVTAPQTGYVAHFDALGIARASLALGAGRETKTDVIDPGAGVEVLAHIGERVEQGQPVARLYGSRNTSRAAELVAAALEMSEAHAIRRPHVLDAL